jgi:uncharacterized protein YjiS (DUF1127 family)
MIAFESRLGSRRRSANRMPNTTARLGRWTGLARLQRLVVRVAAHRRAERGIADLQALDDRVLKDLGIRRCEIRYLVLQAEGAASRRGRSAAELNC